MNILEELYEGNINPEFSICPKSLEYRKLNKDMSDALHNMKKKLSDEDYEELENLLDLRTQMEILRGREAFVQGCKIAGKIIVEVLQDENFKLNQAGYDEIRR